ncbi:MAG: YcxB family protein [Lentisphaeraceae bacterium]|nr:YcxB family protein [Lentisphaeraceae bacterium]
MELSFTGKLTLKELQEIDEYKLHFSFRRPFRFLLYFISTLLLIVSAITIYKKDIGFVTFICGILGAYGTIGWRWDQKQKRKAQWKQQQNEGDTVVKVNEESFYIKTDFTESTLKWDCVESLVDARNGILVMLAKNQCLFYLPNRILEEHEKDKIIKLFKTHKKSIKTIS